MYTRAKISQTKENSKNLLKVSFNPELLSDIIKHNPRTLAYYFLFKHRFTSGCIHNYSIKGVSDTFGLSRTVVRRYVNEMIDLGWCELIGANLQFRRLERIYGQRVNPSQRMTFICLNNTKEIIRTLRFSLMKLSARQQKSIVNLKHRRSNGSYNKLKDLGYKRSPRELNLDHALWHVKLKDFSISHRNLSKKLGLGVSMTKNVIRDLRDANILKVQHNRQFLAPFSPHAYKYLSQQTSKHLLVFKGAIYEQLINSYIFDLRIKQSLVIDPCALVFKRRFTLSRVGR